jgi:hypothetical protein
MLKLLLCLSCGLATAVVTLQLRQQQLNLKLQANRLHNQIEASQSQLWNQQLRIAVCTSPDALSRAVGNSDLKLISPALATPPAGSSSSTPSRSSVRR